MHKYDDSLLPSAPLGAKKVEDSITSISNRITNNKHISIKLQKVPHFGIFRDRLITSSHLHVGFVEAYSKAIRARYAIR